MAAGAHSIPGAMRSAVLASADADFRRRVGDALSGLRWQVREAKGGAEALACLEKAPAETVVLDSWLPDLEIREFIGEFRRLHPEVDLVTVDASMEAEAGARSPRRNEVLHALRSAEVRDGAIWNTAPSEEQMVGASRVSEAGHSVPCAVEEPRAEAKSGAAAIAELIGSHPEMLEVSRRIRLVAPRSTQVLIEGPTGSGKDVVAQTLHRLSPRASRKWVALNCAAIPEALLEAELFGHTRGAFTGAERSRVGRIEAASGGTLFLDEIGEMPLALQAKLLRFLETGEIQRVGENEPVKVDVRIVAATHRPLARLAAEGGFRQDLYYRLAVFLIRMPALAGRTEDIEALTEHFLAKLAADGAGKSISKEAMARLLGHKWPGNVRELAHVLERAWILAEDRSQIDVGEIEFDEVCAVC
ncbi:MAG TPA: sigma-54 dependent transcriptional regulator [Acidobacteriaceae bacterium]|nr:sigma-54 dependent transcriptional regulator [Acidobacteriaceae bacterium]